jgi:hypothetical protein
MIGLLFGVSAVIIRRHLGRSRIEEGSNRSSIFDPRSSIFFLGAGFMLIETKGITELGLVFGNTWSVAAIVVASILLMCYASNQWVLRMGRVGAPWAYGLLFASLALGWVVAKLSLAGVSLPLGVVVLPLALTLPLFFAGLIFSSALSTARDAGSALSANLFGAMLGGFLEYNSMYWGYTSLYPLGIGLYGLAFVCHCFGHRRWQREESRWREEAASLATSGLGPVQAPTPSGRSAISHRIRYDDE